MLLTHKQILEEVRRGNIHIAPFSESQLNPNSYNLRLDSTLKVYSAYKDTHDVATREYQRSKMWETEIFPMRALDMAQDNPTEDINIPENGLVLFPGILYLAATVETAGSAMYVPCIEGRSSIGRLGVFVHVTAGFGDLGFSSHTCPAQWTLEIAVVHPIRVYAGVQICQVAFMPAYQEEHLGTPVLYQGKYSGQRGPKASAIWKELKKGE